MRTVNMYDIQCSFYSIYTSFIQAHQGELTRGNWIHILVRRRQSRIHTTDISLSLLVLKSTVAKRQKRLLLHQTLKLCHHSFLPSTLPQNGTFVHHIHSIFPIQHPPRFRHDDDHTTSHTMPPGQVPQRTRCHAQERIASLSGI